MAGLFDSLFREEDSKIEHLGLELSLSEVGDIVKTVCSRDVFRSDFPSPPLIKASQDDRGCV